MYFHWAGWLGDWIMAARSCCIMNLTSLIALGRTLHKMKRVRWCVTKIYFSFFYSLYHRIPYYWSLRTCSTISYHIASLSTPLMKWAATSALNLKMSQIMIFCISGTITVANIHTSIGWPLTITLYPVSVWIATFLLIMMLICFIFLQHQVLLLVWSASSAKVASSSHTCATA